MGLIDRLFGGSTDTEEPAPEYRYECQVCGEKYETSRVACDTCQGEVTPIG